MTAPHISFRFRPHEHLRRPADFRRVYERRRSVSDDWLIVYACENGLPYLRLVYRSRHWRIYAVRDPTPLAQGAATLTGLGPNSMQLTAHGNGTTLIRVRWSPYWDVTQVSGCVAPAGAFTRLETKRPGPVHIAVRFALSRVGATSPRCH